MQSLNITHFSQDHLRTISSFLSSSDAVEFSNTCHRIHRDLNLGLLKVGSFEDLQKTNQDDDFHLWIKIPLILEEKVHSVLFHAIWRDQGWGNRKGEIAITSTVEKRPTEIVARSGIADHHDTSLQLSFKVEPGKEYYLMYKVGGGGGHSLHVMEVDLKYLIHGASFAKMCNGINQGRDLLIALIDATCNSFETSLMNGNSPDRYFASVLLKQFGISKIDRETIDNLRDLARLLKEERCIPKVFRTDLPDAFEARSEDYWGEDYR